MLIQQYICPSCGAPLPQKFRYTRILVCDYCKGVTLLNADSLELLQEKVVLTDYDSLIQLHSFFRWNEEKMEVIGRIRYRYDSGFWDEWLLLNTAEPNNYWWLHEDEGDFSIFLEDAQIMIEDNLYERMQIGKKLQIDTGKKIIQVFLCEKSEASVMGYEGEIPYPIKVGEKIQYVDGFWEGKMASCEFIKEKCYIYLGIPLGITQILDSIRK